MKREAWLLLIWSVVLLILWQVLLNGRDPLTFRASGEYGLRCEGWRTWIWSTPETIRLEDSRVRSGLDGSLVSFAFALITLAGWAILKSPRELTGLVFGRTALTWLSGLGLGLGTVGLVMLVSSGPWAVMPRSLRLDPESMLWVYLHVALLGPLFEEILFRGGLQGSLQELLGRNAGAIVPAVIFLGLHGLTNSTHVAVITMGTVGMTFLRWKTDSLVACIALHVAGNAFMISHNLWLVRT